MRWGTQIWYQTIDLFQERVLKFVVNIELASHPWRHPYVTCGGNYYVEAIKSHIKMCTFYSYVRLKHQRKSMEISLPCTNKKRRYDLLKG